MNPELNDKLAYAAARPELNELQSEYERSGANWGWWGESALDVRLMRWEGQSNDGRKRREEIGSDPFPWDGAFDSRVPTVDVIINYLVSVLLVAYDRAMLRCEPTEANDLENAAKFQKVMEYYRNLLRREIRAEAELLLQNGLTFGAGAFQVTWLREFTTKRTAMTLEQVAQMAAQAPVGSPLAALPQMLVDPAMEEALAELALQLVPALQTTKAARKFVRALRNEGVAEYREPYAVRNAPCVTAMRFGRDLFMPPETTDLQRARVLFRRDFLTEVEIRKRVATGEWDEAWAEEAIKTAGKMSTWSGDSLEENPEKIFGAQFGTVETRNNLVEVVHAYAWQLDEQDIPTMKCTVWCPHVGTTSANTSEDLYAAHYDTDMVAYPFVLWQWERFSRRILASRGVPEIAYTWQLEEKTQCDMLGDLASITVNPPIRVPMARGQKYQYGPGAQNVGRSGEVESMAGTTANAPLAFQIMEMLRRRRAEYFGVMDELVPPALWQTKMAQVVGNWMSTCEEMFAQMASLVLNEDNVSTEELQRITGVDMSGIDRSPEAIARRFDWRMQFDARDLDMDYTLKKLETIAQLAVPLDREGRIGYGKLVAAIMTQVDPTYAQALLGDSQKAAEQVVQEVDAEFVRMLAGNEAHYVENDPTAEMKLQAANEIVMRNPKYQEAYKSDERFREVVENFQKNLQQSITQQENKQVGRTGVKSV